MPPKELTGLSFDNLYFGVPSGDGGYEYKPLCHVEHIDLKEENEEANDGKTSAIDTDCDSMLPRPGEDMYGHFTMTKPGTTKLGWVAITELIWHDNSLYSKFPKKGKRKLRKYNRCRRLSVIRIKKWCRMTFGVSMD